MKDKDLRNNSDKEIQNIKDILEKKHRREFTWEEATTVMWDLKKLAKIVYDIILEEEKRLNLLK